MRQHRLSNAIVTSPDSTATCKFASAIIATCSSSSNTNTYLAKSTITVATIGSTFAIAIIATYSSSSNTNGSGSGFAVWRRFMHSYRLERPRRVVLMRFPH